jgi:hypothetical protein
MNRRDGANAIESLRSKEMRVRQDQIYSLVGKFRNSPSLMRKIKIFLVVGFVGVVLAGALVIWAAVATFSYVADVAQNSDLTTSQVTAKVEDVRKEIHEMSAVTALGCWQTAQHLLNFEPWLERPVGQNLGQLKVACLEGQNSAESQERTESRESEET